mmetsp:Transcript_25781/g.60443  ORF Transcript_25781/g.60443 Transcript_25781/m.60443 type:complete len:427 (+) Transcript_25781:74-1354(+)
MVPLAVHYNNLGVDILSRDREPPHRYKPRADDASTVADSTTYRDTVAGEASSKRRKIMVSGRTEARPGAWRKPELEDRVDEALAYFQRALSLIVQTAQHHHFYGSGLKYRPSDADGFLRYENEAMGKQLLGSVNTNDTNIDLKGEKIHSSNEYIHWKAVKIGMDFYNRNSNTTCKSKANEDGDGDSDDGDYRCDGDFARALNHHEEEQQRFEQSQHDDNDRRPFAGHHPKTYNPQKHKSSGGYESLTRSIFHSMICIYNIALCYHYKGMIAKARQIRTLITQHRDPLCWGYGPLGAAAVFYLNAAVDHYTRAYELMSRFRLEDGSQYTLLMAMMNNLAATYGSLDEPSKAEICNRYLVRSLILVICSSERDGRADNDNDGAGKTDGGGVLSRAEDRASFEAFLMNVTHLMIGDDERYHGEVTAVAA